MNNVPYDSIVPMAPKRYPDGVYFSELIKRIAQAIKTTNPGSQIHKPKAVRQIVPLFIPDTTPSVVIHDA
jgi:hypothetical protein